MRASGACARSVARSAGRVASCRDGSRVVAAPTHECEHVREEQRAAQREHQLAHDLVVEAHSGEHYRRASRIYRRGFGPKPAPAFRSRWSETPRFTERATRRRHRPSCARSVRLSGHAVAEEAHVGLRSEIGELHRGRSRTRGSSGPARPAIDAPGRRTHVVRNRPRRRRASPPTAGAPPRGAASHTATFVHQIALVRLTRPGRRSSRFPRCSTCSTGVRLPCIDCWSARPFGKRPVKSRSSDQLPARPPPSAPRARSPRADPAVRAGVGVRRRRWPTVHTNTTAARKRHRRQSPIRRSTATEPTQAFGRRTASAYGRRRRAFGRIDAACETAPHAVARRALLGRLRGPARRVPRTRLSASSCSRPTVRSRSTPTPRPTSRSTG